MFKKNFKKGLLVIVLLLLAGGFLSAFSQERRPEKIVVTTLNRETVDKKEVFEIVLNGKIQIKEIEIDKFAGRTTVKFPAFISRGGIVYSHVEVLKEELQQEIIRAVESGKPSLEDHSELRWEITRMRPFRGRGKTRAHFSVTFNEALRVNGRMIARDDGTVWIGWPARPPREGESGWQEQGRILDRELRRDIERALIENYKKL
jgi:DNA-binding cell septation regulator SpoVG